MEADKREEAKGIGGRGTVLRENEKFDGVNFVHHTSLLSYKEITLA
jgi:hypothetical protein